MIHFKHEEDRILFATLHPILIMVFADMYNYAKRNYGIELVVTQTVTTKQIDDRLGRVSNSHRTNRAIDIRSKTDASGKVIDVFILQDIIHYVNSKPEYYDYKYISHSGERRLAYHHGSWNIDEHIHLSIHSRYSL